MSYESINNILRDKAQGWSLDYYNDKKTSYDVPLVRAQAMLELMKKEGEHLAAQKKHASLLALSKTTSKPSQRVKDEIKAIESVISQLKGDVLRLSFTSHGATRCYSSSKAEDIINILAYKQLLEQQRFSSLQGVRNIFMMTGDEEAMCQGVEQVERRFTANMASLDSIKLSSEPQPESAQESGVASAKRNRRYREEEEDDWPEHEVKGLRSGDW